MTKMEVSLKKLIGVSKNNVGESFKYHYLFSSFSRLTILRYI
jgi:hypothetical protein